jgi:hypothetical protein
VDKRYKLLRKMAVTHAAVADTTVFEALLDRTNTSRDLYADRGYPTAEREATLKQAGWRVHIQRKGSATKGISEAQKETQPSHRHTARPRRTRVWRAGANGRQVGALHGHRPCHIRFASQGGKLQPETVGVSEERWSGTVLIGEWGRTAADRDDHPTLRRLVYIAVPSHATRKNKAEFPCGRLAHRLSPSKIRYSRWPVETAQHKN